MAGKSGKKKAEEGKYTELFIEESREQLEQFNEALLTLEGDRTRSEEMNEAFRLVHTIKGTANLLGFDAMGDLAHAMEDVMDGIRGMKIDFVDEIPVSDNEEGVNGKSVIRDMGG